MNLGERIHHQCRDLTVCNTDLRHVTDPEVRDFIKRLRRIREEGMWRIEWPASGDKPDYYEVDWAAHRLAVAVGVDAPLQRHGDAYQGIQPNDVRTLLVWLRALDDRQPAIPVSVGEPA